MGAIQSSINRTLAGAAAGITAVAKAKAKKEEDITSTQNSLHIANDRAIEDSARLEEAQKNANEKLKTTARTGKTLYRDKKSGKFIPKYDYEKAQTALSSAKEQSDLAKAIADSYRARLQKLTGGKV